MPVSVQIFGVFLLTSLVVASNYFVQFPINDFLTYGALTYPFTFLISDILSEKYSKQEVLKIVRWSILLAFVPSMFLAELRIAFASVCAFFVAQQIDVYAFYWLKDRFPKLWWLRTAGSTAFSQFLDTMVFFHVAFLFTMPWTGVVSLMMGDYSIKFISALMNTPVFYLFAIRIQGIFKVR